MRWVSLIPAVAALGTGLWAAWLWYQSSLIVADPGWPKDQATGIPFAPVDPTLNQMGWTAALLKAGQDTAALNAKAARWTAITVVLTTVASVAGNL